MENHEEEPKRERQGGALERGMVLFPSQEGGLSQPGGDVTGQGGEEPTPVFSAEEIERLTRDIVSALKTVYDPEIPVDVYELGLIYRVDIDDDRVVRIDMTLTAPNCPVAGELPVWVRDAVSVVEGVGDVDVRMVFDPPWGKERMSSEARVALDMF